jgi:Flp pilus assembly protein TadD
VTLARAEQLVDLRRYDEARAMLYALLAQDPHDVDVVCAAAHAELAAGDFARAEELAVRAVGEDPDSDHALRLHALSALGLGRPDEAMASARRAVSLAPTDWQCHAALASAASAASVGGALAAARRAVQLAPTEPEAHLVLGRVALEAKDVATANGAFAEALRLDPQSSAALTDLGRLAALTNSPLAAVDQVARAARLDPRAPDAARNVVAAALGVIATAQTTGFFAVYVSALPMVGYWGSDGQLVGEFWDLLMVIGAGWLVVRSRSTLGGRLWRHLRSAARLDRRVVLCSGLVALALLIVGVGLLQPGEQTRFDLWLLAALVNAAGVVVLGVTARLRPKELVLSLGVPALWVAGVVVNYVARAR